MAYNDIFFESPSAHSRLNGFSVHVARGANSVNDVVEVTFDSDPVPKARMQVEWRPRISEDGANILAPARDDPGCVVFLDGGMPWLIW